jgi:ketosteroid isomerase-like protein
MHDPVVDKAAVDAVRNQEMSALNSGVVDSMIVVYSDDIVMMPPNEAAVTGSAALRTWIDTTFKQVTMTGRYISSSVEVSGDLAVDHYTAELTVTPKAAGATPMTESIKGLHVLRRQADGSWKITQDIWNSDAPPPAPAK